MLKDVQSKQALYVIHLPSDDFKSVWFRLHCFNLEKQAIHDFSSRWEACGSLCKLLKMHKRAKNLYLNPLLYPCVSPANVEEVNQILTWQLGHKKGPSH